ncbi:hypothetical protein MSAN_01681700 [Mycena sanguinolenta]|uniref:Uncharacterized protein n=1 Tax=Mycena sanguinolenta TaxID=230812 RepID=A0A8H6Y047_9AGAR|nr:hypothetical protein MSAN_01681700 [Mycena sanguinolenta]
MHSQPQAATESDALAHPARRCAEEEIAHPDGLAYAQLAPAPLGGSQSQSKSSGQSTSMWSGDLGSRGQSSERRAGYEPVEAPTKPRSQIESKRRTKSPSSATPSTLVSPLRTTSLPHSPFSLPLSRSATKICDSAIDDDDSFGPFPVMTALEWKYERGGQR